MGTPAFAVASLETLLAEGYNVVGVVTMPDKPAGRGHKVQYSAVKTCALQHGLPLLQPEKLRDETFLEALRAWHADLQIVVAFRMLPEVVWAMPRMGTFNLHAALLPQYRGAAPINWAVIHGDKVTGVTTFFLDQQIDTGRIILKEAVEILDTDDAGAVHDRLMEVGRHVVVRTVDLLLAAGGDVSALTTQPQDELIADLKHYTGISELRPAPKIFKEDCLLSFDQNVRAVHNRVRGLSPAPAAWTTLGTFSPVKVFRTEVVTEGIPQPQDTIGRFSTDGKTFLHVVCADGILALQEIQLPGKRRMDIQAALNGYGAALEEALNPC